MNHFIFTGTINGVVHIPVSTNEIVTEIQDDSIRTQYVPPEPRISILSRPKKSSPSKTRESQSKSKNQQPVKTLEQVNKSLLLALLRCS